MEESSDVAESFEGGGDAVLCKGIVSGKRVTISKQSSDVGGVCYAGDLSAGSGGG